MKTRIEMFVWYQVQHTEQIQLVHKWLAWKWSLLSGDKGHATGKFDVLTGKQKSSKSNAPSYTKVFADSLLNHAAQDSKICAVTAAMPDGTGLNLFAERYPSRCFDVGIAEQHGVTFSAALAAGGMKPFCAMYSTFLQRGYDQVVHDVALQNLPVRFAIDRVICIISRLLNSAWNFPFKIILAAPLRPSVLASWISANPRSARILRII